MNSNQNSALSQCIHLPSYFSPFTHHWKNSNQVLRERSSFASIYHFEDENLALLKGEGMHFVMCLIAYWLEAPC